MSKFDPFRGVRYDEEAVAAPLELLVAPPYDVIDDDERRALEAAHPKNAVRLILPEEPDRYRRAAADFAAWSQEGILRPDPVERFYAYRMDFRDRRGHRRHTIGVVGALALPEAGDDSVRPHERTLPKARRDRLELLRAVRANLDPIWALSPSAGLTDLLRDVTGSATPLSRCRDADGVTHSLFALDDPDRIAAVSAAVSRSPLVIADGHHRFETACALRDEGADVGEGAGRIMAFVVELSDEELHIAPIHRLVKVADSPTPRERLAGTFEITEAGPLESRAVEELIALMETSGGIGLADATGLALLVAGPGARAEALVGVPEQITGTDSALVEAVAGGRWPDAEWAYRHDADAVVAQVAAGQADAALLLRPVTLDQTRAAALAGVRMPQKTTFFAPKPRTGLVFRRLEG